MDTWTALTLSRRTSRGLQCNAAPHRLAELAAASAHPRRRTAACADLVLELLDLLDGSRST